MFVNFAVILIVLSQTQKIQSLFVSVGDYSNESIPGLNTPECGLSALPIVYHLSFEKSYENNCFRNKYKNKTLVFFDIHDRPEKKMRPKKPIISRIHNGTDERDPTKTPWVVFVGANSHFGFLPNRCTGVLITFEWILTAAHCYEDMKSEILSNIIGYLSLTISLGANNKLGAVRKIIYKKAKFISHYLFVNPRLADGSEPHNETETEKIRFLNDIALIKVSDISQKLRHDDRYLINTICLPKRNEVNEGFQDFAYYYGYGVWTDNWLFNIFPDYLQKAWINLQNFEKCYRGNLCGYSFLDDPKACGGDSGGPLVQFIGEGIENRAVLAGTLRGGGSGKCIEAKWLWWVPTSKHIDWILTTIKNN